VNETILWLATFKNQQFALALAKFMRETEAVDLGYVNEKEVPRSVKEEGGGQMRLEG